MHDYTLCFIGSHYYSVSYNNYISVLTYYIWKHKGFTFPKYSSLKWLVRNMYYISMGMCLPCISPNVGVSYPMSEIYVLPYFGQLLEYSVKLSNALTYKILAVSFCKLWEMLMFCITFQRIKKVALLSQNNNSYPKHGSAWYPAWY